MIYVLSGTPAVTVANDRRSLQQGEGIHLPPGINVSIQAEAGATAELVQYQLGRSADLAKSVMRAPASVTDLHQMNIPANALKPGPYEFSMIRVTLPAGHPSQGLTRDQVPRSITYWQKVPLPCGPRQPSMR